jgi:hypothetical protein
VTSKKQKCLRAVAGYEMGACEAAILLLPQVVEVEGGIPRRGRSPLEAVNRWCQSKGVALRVLSLNDCDGEIPLNGGIKALAVRGFNRSKSWFVARGARGLWAHKSGIGLIGLANFLSAAPVLRAAGRGFGIGLIVHGIEAWEKTRGRLDFLMVLERPCKFWRHPVESSYNYGYTRGRTSNLL